MVCNPLTIQVAEEVLIDLRQRLARTRWPDSLPDAGWDYGTNRSYLQQLVSYWHDTYDWRAQERFLNTFSQFTTQIDGIHLHFQHVKGKGAHPLPLLISHGWPGSFFEMYQQGFSHFERRRVKSERGFSPRASCKRTLSFFMHPPWNLAETLIRSLAR